MINICKFMSCIIYASSSDLLNSWEYIHDDVDIKYTKIKEYNLEDIIRLTNNKIIKKRGVGTFIEIDKKILYVTCLHIIGTNNMKSTAYYIENEKMTGIPLKLYFTIPEIDIAVFEPQKEYIKQIKPYLEKNIVKIDKIEKYKSEINITTYDIKEKPQFTIGKKNILISSLEIVDEYCRSTMLPKFPTIKYDIDHYELYDEQNVEGMSGTPLVYKEMLFGITLSYENKMQAIPMILICELIKHYNQQCMLGYFFNTKVINMETENDVITGHYISECKNVTYITNKSKKKFKFEVSDIIISVNNVKINNKGRIYDDKIGYDFALDTYLTLITNMYKYVDIEIYREIKGKYVIFKHQISGNSYDQIYNINIFNDYKYLYWNGCIFTELSEELLYDLNMSGINIMKSKILKCKKITDDKKKHVILIDVVFEILHNKLIDKTKTTGLPFINTPDGYDIYVVEKIGNKKINNLNDLKICLSESMRQKQITIQYQTNADENNKLTLELS